MSVCLYKIEKVLEMRIFKNLNGEFYMIYSRLIEVFSKKKIDYVYFYFLNVCLSV
jgi:hypothetical protein